jgi:hypothetical protein
MPLSSFNTPLSDVQWGEFQQYIDSKIETIYIELVGPYTGKEENIPGNLLVNSPRNIQRMRELLTLSAANQPPYDAVMLQKMIPYQRLIMEYQLKADINGDGKIYNWDYVYMRPQPILTSMTGMTGAEKIPGEMPPNGLYSGYKVSGKVYGATQQGVVISVTGTYSSSVTTNVNGDYTLYLSNGNFTLTPSKTGFVFTPPFINVVVSGGNVPGNDFVASV